MKIPFPTHIPLNYVAIFALLVAVAELTEGTTPFFSLCVFLFIIATGIGFNVAGGLSTVAGGFIFFAAMQTAIIGWCTKIVINEPGQSNLLEPDKTVMVYLGTMVSMIVAAELSRRFSPKKAFLSTFLTDENSMPAATGCLVVGIALTLATELVEHGPGDFLSAAAQLNSFLLLAIIIGTTYQIRKSGGTRSVNLVVILAGLPIFVIGGLIGFSKQGLFTPFVGYLVACAVSGYRFSRKQVAGGALVGYFLFHFMVPYSQYGRGSKSDEQASYDQFSHNVGAALDNLADLQNLPAEYAESNALQEAAKNHKDNYFDQTEGIFDRLNMLSPDDALIEATDEGRSQYGISPLIFSLENVVPHFIWKSKPSYSLGNLYAHEIGTIGEDDFTTGIAFGPASAAYHMQRWIGVFIVAPIVLFIYFLFFSWLCGDVRKSPWGVIALTITIHGAPEGGLTGPVDTIVHVGLPLIFIAYFCAYVMPLVGTLFVGPQKRRIATLPG